MLTNVAKETKEMELEKLTGMELSVDAKKDLKLACETKNDYERRLKSGTDLKEGNNTKEEKALWRERLTNCFIGRIKKKKQIKGMMRYWYNKMDKFNELLQEVASEYIIELKKVPPEDVLFPTEIWTNRDMELPVYGS